MPYSNVCTSNCLAIEYGPEHEADTCEVPRRAESICHGDAPFYTVPFIGMRDIPAMRTSRTAKGLGVRYFAAEKLGIHVGVDVARGPEETYWYLTMGSAWR